MQVAEWMLRLQARLLIVQRCTAAHHVASGAMLLI
jgi:hypothetical protein